MGYFSEIVSEARNSGSSALLPAAAEIPEQQHVQSQGTPSAPAPTAPEPAPALPEPDPSPAPEQPSPAEPAMSAHIPPPEVKLTVTGDATQAPDDTAARQAHEAAEAKRKAEFDARQAEKKAKRKAALDRIKTMNDAELLEAAMGRVAADTERLTRRNMKEAVAEHISAKCREDAAFAMLVMDPVKSMINCFQYINRQAQKYAEQEMKDNGIERHGVYSLDVPDGLCYQWAEDYFKDENAKEDIKNNDEEFVPRPYIPPTRKASKAKAAKGKPEKKSVAAKPKSTAGVPEQISLM